MEMCPGVVFNSVAEYLKTYRELSAEAVRLGFIDSMSRNLASQPLAKAYEKLHFFLVDSKEPLLLGDSICVFETGGKRRFAPFAGGDDDIRQCYLPLSPSKALLGNHVEARPDFRPQFWNSVVARCSEQFFVSSTELPIDSPIIKDLGIWAGIYTESMWSIRERQLRSSFLSDVRNGIFATDSRAKFVTTTDQLPREKTLVRSIRSS